MVSRPAESPPHRPPVPDTWLRTAQVADLLGCSKSNVQLFVRGKKLHPRHVTGHGGHEDYRFDPAEVHAFANGRREKRRAKQVSVTGQIAARVYRLLDLFERQDKLDTAHREIVRRVKIDPDEAQRLFERWLLPFDAALKFKQEAETQAKRERDEERQAARATTLERERLLAERAGAKADAAMFEGIARGGRRGKKDDTP